MRFLVRLLILMMLFAVNFAAVRVAAQESDAPYIFYYGAGEIVIERADGTDRTVLGEGLDVWPMVNLTWSSSGRWIAWDNIVYNVFGEIETDTITIAAASYDGEHSYSIDIPVLYYDFDWRWSPTEDWILVSNIGMGSGPTIANSQVIDVANGEVVLTIDDVEGYPVWSFDGQYVELNHYEQRPSASDPTQVETILTRTQISMNGDQHETTSVAQPTFWISDNTIIYWDETEGSYFVKGPAYETPVSISSPTGMRIQQLYWNRARDLALVYALEPVPDSNALYEQNFYLLSLADRTITFINTFRVSPLDNEISRVTTSIYGVNWSPADNAILVYAIDGNPTYINRFYNENGWSGPSLGLYLVTLSTASTDLVTPTAMLPTYGGAHSAPTPIHLDWMPWTLDGGRFLFATQERELAWFEVGSRQITLLDLPIYSDMYLLRTVSPTYGLNWSEDGQHAVLTWRHNSWLYDPATDTVSAEPISQHSLAYISPDGRYAVSLVACYAQPSHSHGPTPGRCMIDVETGERTDLAVTGIFAYGGGGWAEWHPSSQWVILIEDRSERYSGQYYSITDTSGKYYRDLTDSFEGRASVDWLPDNVPMED